MQILHGFDNAFVNSIGESSSPLRESAKLLLQTFTPLFMGSSTFKLILLANSLVALLTSGVTLVLLLIAPLGLATVLTCTLLVGLFTLAGGLAGDLLIVRLVGRGTAWGDGGGAPGPAGLTHRNTTPQLNRSRRRLPQWLTRD
jgi:hypothetical protein